ncbi:hypothetical protein [Fibrobacter sp. UBA4297]|uniref:hypothetical protein n=1 Tax=Fibrobacter sp. UBA4297 TaxID=1946536 RepID=UPI0025BCC2BD|nr:hypothetical protein [Fibrobacter sp. UBA4297]
MSSKFTSPLILSSVLALGTLSFIACGEDSNPNLPNQTTPSSSSVYVPPAPSIETSIVFESLDAANLNTGVKFSGTISIDLGDSNTVVDVSAAHFTQVTTVVVKKETQVQQGTASFSIPIDFNEYPIQTVPLGEWGLKTDFENGYTDCGDFELIITAVVEDGIAEPSVSVARIPFERPSRWCMEPESSSSEAPEVIGAPLDSFEIQVDTKINKCINVAAKAVSPDENGDVCFDVNTSSIGLSSTTGVKFALYGNKDDNDYSNDYGKKRHPSNPTTTDFIYAPASLQETYPNFLSATDKFFVGIAPTYDPQTNPGTGFFTFVVIDKGIADANGHRQMTLFFYKTAQ